MHGDKSTTYIAQKMLRFAGCVEVFVQESIQHSILEEQKESEEGDVAIGSITVMTDARHASRKKSFHTDHVALGQLAHKVVNIQHITKGDDVATQRHEKIGCERMYKAMDKKGGLQYRSMCITETCRSTRL